MAARPQTEACGNCRGRSGSLSGIMQIVTSAVRVDVALTLSRRCSLFASATLDLDLDITAPTVQWTLPPVGHWRLAPGHFVLLTCSTVPPPKELGRAQICTWISLVTESSQTPSWLRRRRARREFHLLEPVTFSILCWRDAAAQSLCNCGAVASVSLLMLWTPRWRSSSLSRVARSWPRYTRLAISPRK